MCLDSGPIRSAMPATPQSINYNIETSLAMRDTPNWSANILSLLDVPGFLKSGGSQYPVVSGRGKGGTDYPTDIGQLSIHYGGRFSRAS